MEGKTGVPSERSPVRPTRGVIPKLGVRREALILLPVASLVLIGLSAFTLFSYRAAIDRFTDVARSDALASAQALALELSVATRPREVLQRAKVRVPRAQYAAILDAQGLVEFEAGDSGLGNPFGLLGGPPGRAVTLGPDEETLGRVVALLPITGGRTLELDIDASVVFGQQRALPLLTVVVLAIDGALMTLVLFFLRQWMTPFETLLARAREVAPGENRGAKEDEVEFLLTTFDRAIASMVDKGSVEDDIASLQRTLSPSFSSGLLLLSSDGAVLALNPVGAQLLAVEQPSVECRLEELLVGHDALVEVLQKALRTGEGLMREECSVTTSDGVRLLGLTVHPLKGQSENVGGWLVLFADLTEVEADAREQRLSESLQQIGQLTAGLAHELRNSVASFRGYLRLIEREPGGSGVPEYLAELRHESDHLQRVLEDLLTFARPGSARLEEIDLEQVIRRATADASLGLRELGDPTANVSVESPGTSIRLQADPQLLERALRNLIHNALRAQRRGTSPDRPVTVRLEPTKGHTTLRIQDTGPGIPEELRERLFVPFSTGSADGVGLGLALARRIIDLHGGTLDLADRPEGGVEAVVKLPRGSGTPVTKRSAR